MASHVSEHQIRSNFDSRIVKLYEKIFESRIHPYASDWHLVLTSLPIAMCHPTPDASKNVKFLLSRNPTKFD